MIVTSYRKPWSKHSKVTAVFCLISTQLSRRCQWQKGLCKKKTACYQWGKAIPFLVAVKKHHKKQDAEARSHAVTWTAWTHDDLCFIPAGGEMCCQEAAQWDSFLWVQPWELTAVPAPPPDAGSADVPSREGSCGSQILCFHLPGGLAPPGCGEAAHSFCLSRPF